MKDDYFVNHAVAPRWPFTIYHAPVWAYVAKAVAGLPRGARCLNVGCGLFHDYPALSTDRLWSACDIDPRCIEAVKTRYPGLDAAVCTDFPDYQAGSFDFVMAIEVVEHLRHAPTWLQRLFALGRPGARILVSTPNYGISMLPVVEYTALEVLARLRGFSRFGIHPNKYTRQRLACEVRQAAPAGARVEVRRLSMGMVLMADVRVP